jgi:hypothetical protein
MNRLSASGYSFGYRLWHTWPARSLLEPVLFSHWLSKFGNDLECQVTTISCKLFISLFLFHFDFRRWLTWFILFCMKCTTENREKIELKAKKKDLD